MSSETLGAAIACMGGGTDPAFGGGLSCASAGAAADRSIAAATAVIENERSRVLVMRSILLVSELGAGFRAAVGPRAEAVRRSRPRTNSANVVGPPRWGNAAAR